MKRRLRHRLIGVVILIAAVAVTHHRLHSLRRSDEGFHLPETARARLTTVLDTTQWTAFRIPATAIRLKLQSRAQLAGEPEELLDREFPYEVEYELETAGGETLSQGAFALRSMVIPTVNAEGDPQSAAFVEGSDLTPTSVRASTLELAPGEVRVLKLRARAFQEPVGDIAVRTFIMERVPDSKLSLRWNRLSPNGRARISRPRIHALVDLSKSEQRSALRNQWIPLGPQGVEGRDYRDRTLYLRDDLFPARRRLIEPLGIGELRCNATRRAVIGIPPPGGTVRLEFRRPTSASPATVQLRFFGESIHQRSTTNHPIRGRFSAFSAPLGPGLLEIESPVEVTVLPYWTTEGGDEQRLEPDRAVIRTWLAGPEEGVTFPLGGNREQSDFFRASVRPLADAATLVQFAYLDPEGTVLQEGERWILPTPSLYDVLLTDDGQVAVNDPVDLILRLPAGVAAIRFRADSDVLLGGYTRPGDLPHRTRVPADYIRALPDPQRLPVWFGLRPEQANDLIRSHRSRLIHAQPRPPEDDEDILAGNYQWEDFHPTTGALGQYLLSDRDPDAPSRTASLPSLFMPVPIGADQPLDLAHPPGLDLPSRRIVFLRRGNEPKALRISIDGAPFIERNLVTTRGEFVLPPIPPESRTIRIDSPAEELQCFLNYVKPIHATKLKRLAQRISPGKSLVFHCEKTTDGDELVTGTIFSSPHPPAESEIQVAIRPGEGGGFLPVADSFTLRDRRYLVTPNPDSQTPVLSGNLGVLDGGRRFFIPLRADLQPGTYQVTITVHAGSEGFLTLSKVTGGDYSDARFFREMSR